MLQDWRGQLTPKVFDILHVLRGQFTAVIEMNIFQQKLFLSFMGIFAFIKPFFSRSVHYLLSILSQIIMFNQ